MREKIQKILYIIADALELIMAVLVAIGIIVAICAVVPQCIEVWKQKDATQDIIHVLEMVFSIVIAIEFLKMMLRPGMSTTVETLIFLISRHMIVKDTTPTEDLLSVISICLLFALEYCLRVGALNFAKRKRHKGKHKEAYKETNKETNKETQKA